MQFVEIVLLWVCISFLHGKSKAKGERHKNKQVNTIKAGTEERHYYQNNVMKPGTQIYLTGIIAKGTIP